MSDAEDFLKSAPRANSAAAKSLAGLDYARKYLLPHVNKFDRQFRNTTGTKCILIISDTHATYLDPVTWSIFLDVAKDLEPETVVMNGDILDGSSITRHLKYPDTVVDLSTEFAFCRRQFEQLRERLPSSRIVWVAGNHGLDRLAKYLATTCPEVARLDNLRIDQLLRLDDLDIDLAQGGKYLSPKGTEHEGPRMCHYGVYLTTHGTRLGKYPAHAELAQWGISGTSGHVHRAQLAFGSIWKQRTLSWMSTPMGATIECGRAYIDDHAGWQTGFGIAFIHKGHVRQYPVLTDKGVAVVEGRVYEAKRIKRKDPTKVWL